MHHTPLFRVYMEHEDKEGKRVKWMRSAAALALVLLGMAWTASAAAQAQVQVFFAGDTLESEQIQRLMDLTQRAFPQAEWTAILEEETGESLREMILSDRAPTVAVCAPGDAGAWAREGILVPLGTRIPDQAQIQPQVRAACMWDGEWIMAPLIAHHRQMAVNRRMLEHERLGYMIDHREHPIWYPPEIDQILEEFYLSDAVAMEIWPARAENSAAIEALLQAMYGGEILSEDGQACRANNASTLAGLNWLRDRVRQGIVGMAKSRDAALERFLAGETAVFIDWMAGDEAQYARTLKKNGVEIVLMPYPTTSGVPVRSFELTGVCVLAGGEDEAQALGEQAVAFWCGDVQTQLILGERAIWQDDAIWLPMMNATGSGMAVRSLLCHALDAVLAGQMEPAQALALIDAAAEAAR